MSNCNNYEDEIKRLQEDNDRLQRELSTSEAARKAGELFLRTEVKKQWVFKMNDGTVRSLTDADIDKAYGTFAEQLESNELKRFVDRSFDKRAKPVGSEGRFVNYRMLIDNANISDAEDWAKLTEALIGTWKEAAPDDFNMVTKVWGREELLRAVADAYKEYIDGDEIASFLANNTAGFMNLADKMTRLRFLADMGKEGYLDTLQEVHEFMSATSHPVPDGLKQRLWSSYKLALMAERHVSAAKRNTGQALRSLQEDFDRPANFMVDMAEAQQTLGAKAGDVKADEHFGQVIQAIDDRRPEVIRQLKIAAVVDSIDPKAKLDKGWENTHLRFGNALVKDSQLLTSGTLVRANLLGTALANTHGFVHTAFENIGNLTPQGTRMTREAFSEGLRVAWESASYSHDAVRRSFREMSMDAFSRGEAPYGGSLDAYGPRPTSNEQLLAEVQATMTMPWLPGGPLRPENWARTVHKLQAAQRMLAFHMTKRHELLTPAFRMMSATDSVLGYDAFMFKLKNNLEIQSRRDGVQLGLLDQRSREEWVEKRLEEAFYQAAPTEENVIAFRNQYKLKGSDISDDEIRKIITADRVRNTYNYPTLDTPEAQDAMDYSLANRMQAPPEQGTLAGAVDEAVMAARKHWAVESLVPYWRAPFNNFLFDTRLSFGPIKETIDVMFGPTPTREQIATVQAGWITTGGLLSLFAGLDMLGLVEGNGPLDPDARRAWLLQGNKPNSIAGFAYLGGVPVLNTLFLWKDLKETFVTGNYSNYDQRSAHWGIAQVMTSQLIRQTGFGQMQRLVDALLDPETAMPRMVGWLGQGQLPFSGLMREGQRLTGYGGGDLYQDRDPLSMERFGAGEDDWQTKTERILRNLAYGTIPLLGLPGGAPRKENDMLGQPIQLEFGADWAEALKSRFHPRIWPRAYQRVYAELDAQGMLRLPQPLLTRSLDGVAMSAELQKEYNDTFGSVKGSIPLEARMALAKTKVSVTFPTLVDTSIDLRKQFPGSGIVTSRDGSSATIDLAPFISKHVKGKTIADAFASLFKDPLYQKMQDLPGTTSDLEVRDMPPSRRRQQAASKMIKGVYDYYQLLTRDQLMASDSPAAQDWRDTYAKLNRAAVEESTRSLRGLVEALQPVGR